MVSMSLGRGGGASSVETTAYNRMFNDENVLLVAAAGNSRDSTHSYPASYDAVMSVAALMSDGNIASYSQFNDQVDISAPGSVVYSTVPNNRYVNMMLLHHFSQHHVMEFKMTSLIFSSTKIVMASSLGHRWQHRM